MTKKLLFALTAAVLLVAAPAPKARAGAGYNYTDNYYTDSNYTTAVGWSEELCTDAYNSDGTFTNYRYHERTSCSTNNVVSGCQLWNATTNTWINVGCPDEGLTADGRLRIPVG